MGFIFGREARDNSIRAMQLIHWACFHQVPVPHLVLFTDAKNAFDRMDWSHLRGVLESLGLGPCMLQWIIALYTSPSAQVRVNGLFSSRFPIRIGTRQGVSPLILPFCSSPGAVSPDCVSESRQRDN